MDWTKVGYICVLSVRCVYLSEKCVFMVSDGNVLVLSSIGNNLNQPTDLCLGIKGHAEQLCKTR